MANMTVSGVRRPDGQRKGRNGKEVVLSQPTTVPIPSNVSPPLNALASIGPYKFGFWSVTGAANGAYVSFDATTIVTPGSADITAKAWYVAKAPISPNGPYTFVDAFDVEQGRFLDDDFVTVKDPDPQVSDQLTLSVNLNGTVPTGTAHVLEAASTFATVDFDKWVCVTGQEQISATTLTVAQGSKAEAIAFYKAGQPLSHGLGFMGRLFAEQTWVSWGVTVDGGGPTGKGPVPPWWPLVMDLAAGLALAEAALKLDPKLRSDALRIASAQITASATAIGKAMAGITDWPPKR